MFRKTDYDLVKDLVRDRISKLRKERRKKEELENRKKKEQENKLIDAFETFLRPQRLTQWSEFVQKSQTHESYVALKEMCGEDVVRDIFEKVSDDLERDLELCCKSIRRIFHGQEFPKFQETQQSNTIKHVPREMRKSRSREAKTLKDLTEVFQFHTVKDAYEKELKRSQELEKKKKEQHEESKKRFKEFLASIYDNEENAANTTYEDAKKRLGHRSAWENLESSDERRVLFQEYMKKFTKVTTKKRKRSEDLEEKKKTKKSKKGEITWESIQESFPKKITVAQLKKLCTEKELDTSGRKADLLKRVKGVLEYIKIAEN